MLTFGSSLSPDPVLRTLAPAAGHTDLIGLVCVPLGSLGLFRVQRRDWILPYLSHQPLSNAYGGMHREPYI